MNTSASKRTRSSRRSAAPCELASTAALRSPASSISRKRRCRSIASGVVNGAGRRAPPTSHSTVPTRPGLRSAAASIERSRNAVVVFPFVPVTPASSSSFVGSPKKMSAATAIDSRVDGTRSCGTSTSSRRSTTTAAAPRSIASHARSWPSTRSPRTQKKSAPAETLRVSYARSPIVTGRPPATSLGARARIRASMIHRCAEATRNRSEVAQRSGRAVFGASCGISRCWRLKRAISRNAGAATSPP